MIRGGAIFGTALALAGALVLSVASCAHAQVIGGGGGGGGAGACSSNPCPIANGGTGATTAASARTALGVTPANIGAAASGANSDITALNALSYGAHKLLIGEGGSALGVTCAPAAGQLIVGQGATSDPACETVSGDATLSASGALSVASVGGQTPAQLFSSPPAAWGATVRAAVHATAIDATGAITPNSAAGIAGTTAGDNANAGSEGEYVSQTFTSVSDGATANISSITLSAGDWDVSETTSVSSSGGNITNSATGVSSISGSYGPMGTYDQIAAVSAAGVTTFSGSSGPVRFNVTTSTVVYVVSGCSLSAGTCTASGIVRARRVR